MEDLDFDQVEALISGERPVEKKKKKKKSSSRSRSRRRSRSRDRRRRERDEREREREEKRRKEEEDTRKRAIEEANRGDRTVLVLCLNPKASEREVYEFFSVNAGKVRDVQVIRDQKGRSKGLSYVEFYMQESVLKALACSGQCLMGAAIRVQPSQAEKNRSSQATKAVSMQMVSTQSGDGPLRLYVGGLVDSLSTIAEEDIKRLFAPFGEIEFIDLHRDPLTHRCKGYAFVQFRKASEAKEAMSAMNGFMLAGKEIKVGLANVEAGADGVIDENGGIFKDHPQMNMHMGHPGADMPPGLMNVNVQPPPGLMKTSAPAKLQHLPARNLMLKNMFRPQGINLASEPDFFEDIKDDVTQECGKHGSVSHVFVDRMSIHGTVYVRFASMTDATACKVALDKRWFGGNQISVEFMQDALFEQSTGIIAAPGNEDLYSLTT